MLLSNLESFIRRHIADHPQIEPWLGNWTPEHETQVNVDTTDLEPCYFDLTSKPTRWRTPCGAEIGHIRIPHGANTTNPSFADRPFRGAEHHYWQYIGTSGWNWQRRKSEWVGFDFDSIANHQSGLAPEQLQEILNRALSLKYVIARTSKSAMGFHLIVRLDPQPTTRSHGEHSALAKHVLGRMSDDCGYSFHAAADVCGLILWHWSKGLTKDGLRRIPRG